MKTMTAVMILMFSLSLAGCATMQSGSPAKTVAGTVSSAGDDGNMLTEKDYDRMGIKETGIPNK